MRLKLNTTRTDCRWRLHLDWDGPRGADTTTLPSATGTYRTFPVDQDELEAVHPGLADMPTDLDHPGRCS